MVGGPAARQESDLEALSSEFESVTAEAPSARGRARAFLLIRLAVSVAMLGLLISRVDVGALLPSRQLSALLWVAAGLGLSMTGVVMSSLRWKKVLEALGRPAAFGDLVRHCLAGAFVSNFLPSSVGGDVLRAGRLAAGGISKSAAFASVVLERLSGFVALPLITLAAMAVSPDLRHLGAPSALAFFLSVATLGGLGVILLAAGSKRVGARLASESKWTGFAAALHLGINATSRHPGAALWVLGSAVGYQLAIVAASWAGAQALGLSLSWSAVMAFVPVVAIAQVLPVSLNGIGLREGAFALLLAPLGVSTAEAVSFGLLLYGMNLLVSLLGAPAFALGARSNRPQRPSRLSRSARQAPVAA